MDLDHTHTAQSLTALHRDAEGTSYHLHHVHKAGDWRQFDRLTREALTERHDDLHGLPLAAHTGLDGSTGAWYAHMRNLHLTEPVRGSLELVKAQHSTLHPNPGHLGEKHRPVLPGTAILEQAALAVREDKMAQLRDRGQVERHLLLRGTVTGRFVSDHPAFKEFDRVHTSREDGQRQAKMNEMLKYAEDCAGTARKNQGFWLNALNAYAEIGELLRQGYPMPDGWKPRA